MNKYRLKIFILLFFLFVKKNEVFSQIPQTFTISGNSLLLSKQRIDSGIQLYVNAEKQLINDANSRLSRGPYSVTYKKQLPPSGNINDYYSLARYWWPKAQESDSAYFRRDGNINHQRDSISDAQMLINCGDDVFVMGLAYYFTKNEDYAKHAKYLIEKFFFDSRTRMNPNFEYSQVIIGRPNGGAATISATPLISVVEGVQLIKNSSNWLNSDQRKLEEWFTSFLKWMLQSPKTQGQALANSNIGNYYLLQTTTYALFLGDKESAKKMLLNNIFRKIGSQINAAGEMGAELKRVTAWNYVKFNLVALDKLVEVSKKVDIDLLSYKFNNGQSLKDAFNWLIPYARGEKKWSYSSEKVKPTDVSNFLVKVKCIPFSEEGNDIKKLSYRDLLY